MILRLIERSVVLVVSLAVSSVLVFAFMAVLPGDPARVALGVNASEDAVRQPPAR
jgi:peptide/nickel transport system permease protein